MLGNPEQYLYLIIELESNVKAKKRVEEKTDLVYGDSSDESSMVDNDSI